MHLDFSWPRHNIEGKNLMESCHHFTVFTEFATFFHRFCCFGQRAEENKQIRQGLSLTKFSFHPIQSWKVKHFMDLWEWPKGILNYWRLKLSTWLFGISPSPISRPKFLENSNLKKRKMIADWIAYYKSCTSGTIIFHINYCTSHLIHLYLLCYPPVPICTSHLHQPSRLPNCDSWWANSGGNPADWRCHIMWEKYW